MPNWCTNTLQITATSEHEAQAIIDLMTYEGEVTFDNLIPMPEILKKTVSGFTTIDGESVIAWINDHDSKGRPINRLPTPEEAKELEEIGHDTWYSWAIENWGTKWDASAGDVTMSGGNSVTLVFDTAWDPPEPVLRKLAQEYPNAEMQCIWHEEGGENGIIKTAA